MERFLSFSVCLPSLPFFLLFLFQIFSFPFSAVRAVKYRLCAVVGTENTLGDSAGCPKGIAMISIARSRARTRESSQ